jgi:adenosylmethionine-8-amino-7-oxononanoate aminotransferase
MITLAATLTTEEVAYTLCTNPPGVLMHGPTFMANPTACAIANESINLLMESPWQRNIQQIETALKQGLAPLREHPKVNDVRVLGAIGVVELNEEGHGESIQNAAIRHGVWLRPFGRLVYTMPAFNIDKEVLSQLIDGMVTAVHEGVAI